MVQTSAVDGFIADDFFDIFDSYGICGGSDGTEGHQGGVSNRGGLYHVC